MLGGMEVKVKKFTTIMILKISTFTENVVKFLISLVELSASSLRKQFTSH
jgi:hypothetical protein